MLNRATENFVTYPPPSTLIKKLLPKILHHQTSHKSICFLEKVSYQVYFHDMCHNVVLTWNIYLRHATLIMLYIRMIQSLTHGAWPPTVIIFIPSYISHMLLVKGISLFSSIHTDNVTLPYLCIHSGMATRCSFSDK